MQTVSGWPLPADHYRVMLTGGRTMPSDSLRFQAVPSDSLRVNPLRSNLLLLCQAALRTLRIQFSCIRSIVHAKRCGLTGDHTRHLTLFLLSSRQFDRQKPMRTHLLAVFSVPFKLVQCALTQNTDFCFALNIKFIKTFLFMFRPFSRLSRSNIANTGAPSL